MSHSIHIAFCAVLLTAATAGAWQDKPPADPAPPAAGQQPMRVLFIGDELTESQNMANVMLRLAQAGKEPRRAYVETLGGFGSTLDDASRSRGVQRALRSQRWDAVVLQEDERTATKYQSVTMKAARGLAGEIKLRRAKPMLLVTWGTQGDMESQAAIEKSCAEVAAEYELTIIPAGQAWREAEKLDDKLVLYQKDKRQPTAAGAYLTACVVYAVVYEKNPQSLPADAVQGVSAEDAKKLQAAAWKAAQAAKAAPPVKPKQPPACRG